MLGVEHFDLSSAAEGLCKAARVSRRTGLHGWISPSPWDLSMSYMHLQTSVR
jgi:hypothetical protein